MILTATAGTVDAAATQLGIVDANLAMQARSALEAAHAAWRAPTSWPSTVRLEGVRDPDHIHASRKLRQAVTGNLRVGRDWLPAGAMAERSSGTVTSRAAVPSEASSHGPAVT